MIFIKELTTLEEMQQVQVLEQQIWQTSPLPTHQTLTAVKHGGIMVGAYEGETLIGFSYGFAALNNGKTYLCSHMLGIDEAYRSQKIGEKLKDAQREIAIQKGYDLMVWTFDPLETRNGYLNLTKLNGICDMYLENCYGEMQDGFNKGLPSDRFEVHWHLTSDYVAQSIQPDIENPEPLGEMVWEQDNLCRITLHNVDFTKSVYALPVPKDFQQLKASSQLHAMHWRLAVRETCQALFAAGYTAVRLQQQEAWNEYIFVRKDSLALGGIKHENYRNYN
ncbi:MAG: GNAT family N-acetyltransferase, partial [Solibacillus sp.]|uniref:GNAT family N-acetyltransferase n=1 Tax=Solibacillus sp. TaxID=1909654 RepID=UPI0033160F22